MKTHNIFLKIFILLLCTSLVFGLSPKTTHATNITVNETNIGREVAELREENVKHYYMGDGTYQAIAFSHPIHEKDNNGNWKDIDFGLEFNKKDGLYTSKTSDASFSTNPSPSQPLMTLGNESISMSLSVISSESSSDFFSLQNAHVSKVITPQNNLSTFKSAQHATFSSSLLYKNIFPDVDMEYIIDPGTVKENIIVHEKSPKYEYTFALNLAGAYPVMDDCGSILICNAKTDETEYIIPAPFMYDANGIISEAVSYRLIQIGKSFSFTVQADASWINTQERKFPITIDPTFVESTHFLQDTYIDSDTPAATHGSNSLL